MSLYKNVCEVTDQGSDSFHQFFKQHGNILIAEEFKQCIKVWLSNEMLKRSIDF